MITEQDLQAAIAECQGKRNPDASTCIKLAAFYTIRDAMFPEHPEKMEQGTKEQYSFSPAPEATVQIESNSEFADRIDGKRQRDVWPVLDELMDTLHVIQPRLYDAVLEKLW